MIVFLVNIKANELETLRETMKMKKMMNVVLLGMLIILFAGCSGNSSDTVSPESSAKSSAKSIKTFSLNGIEGTINEAENTIAVIMPSGTNVTNLVATFTTTGASVEVDSTVQVSGTTANDFTSPVTYTVTAADATTQDYMVTITVTASSAKSITAFSLGGVAGTINEAENTIAITMPSGTNVTNLVATFTTTGAIVEVGSTVQVSGTTANNFTSPVVYTVTAVDATTQNYTVTVVNEVANEPATAISVLMTPVNPSTVPPGVFCTRTSSITGSYVVTDADGGSVIVMNWYDQPKDGVRVLRQSHTTILASGVTSGTDTLPGRFNINHIITFEATADGVPSNTVSAKIT